MSQQINLFNPEFRKQQQNFSTVAMLQALGLIVLGAGLFYGYARYQVDQLTVHVAEAAKRLEDEQRRFAQSELEFATQNDDLAVKNELAEAEAQLASQKNKMTVLKSGALGNTDGYSAYMRAFARQSVEGLWLTGFEIVGDGGSAQLLIRGGAQNGKLVPLFIRRLNNETVMRGKTFSELQMNQSQGTAKNAQNYVAFVLNSSEISGGAQ